MQEKILQKQSFGDTKTRTAVIAMGNFAGHKGHEQLINFAIAKAKELNESPFVYVGHKVGKDDPIDIDTKLQTLKKLFPKLRISVVENQIDPATGVETPGSHMKKIEYELIKKAPWYNNIIIAVGSDQAKLQPMIESMAKRFQRHPDLKHVQISLYITPRTLEEGGTGYSTTGLRTALKTLSEDEAFKIWCNAYNVKKLGADWIKHLMEVARKNMGISDQKEYRQVPISEESATIMEGLIKKIIVNEAKHRG